MDTATSDVALWLDVYDRLMAAYHAGPAGGVSTATDPVEAILAKALECRAKVINAQVRALLV